MDSLLLDLYNKIKNSSQVVVSEIEPIDTSVIWLNPTTNEIKYYINDEWKCITDVIDTQTLNISDNLNLYGRMTISLLPDWTENM
jgi:hypothetical protein